MSTFEPHQPVPWWRRFLWDPFVWILGLSWKALVVCWKACVFLARVAWWCLIPIRRLLAPVAEWGWWKRNVSRLGLRSMPLRQWLVIGLALLIFLPILTGLLTAAIIDIGDEPAGRSAATVLGSDLSAWGDPDWRDAASSELSAHDIEFVLYEDGSEVYRSTADPLTGHDYPGAIYQIEFDESGSHMAIVYGDTWGPFDENDDDWPVPVVAIGTLIATFAGMGIFFGRTVVRPLAATSAAAGDIAGGDLNIALPGSRVREVAELNAAVQGMAGALSESLSHEAKLGEERRFLIGSIAHDLRTPLFSLRGSLEAITSGVADTDEKRAHYLSTAQEKADTLDRLVTDLFDLTRLEFLEMEPARERIDLSELVERSVRAFQYRASQKEIVLAMSNELNDARIDIDPHLISRAIDNLIDNAVRFTPNGGSVTVTCSSDERGMTIIVSDTGPGIPETDLEHIFDPLYRGEGSRNRKMGGAGLGLTIARRIFNAHGGELVASNGVAGGALFTATLPFPGAGLAR